MPRRVLILVAALVVAIGAALVVVGPFSGDDQPTETAATATTNAPTTTAATTTTTLDPAVACDPARFDPTDLESLVEVTVPLGFVRQADAIGDTGPSDLAKAIRDDGEPDAAEALGRTKFLRGYQRLWLNRAGVELSAFVYEFCDAAGATSYRERVGRFTGASDYAPFTVEGLEDAVGLAGRGERTVAVVSLAHHSYLVVTMAGVAGEELSLDDVRAITTDLATAITEKLPAPAE